MMAVELSLVGDALQPVAPRQLFARANYDVTKAGQRSIMIKHDVSAGRLRVVVNWRATR